MTYIDEILILANQLANAGKKPSIALIKAKLNVQVPLPVIINTLKNWTHDSNFIAQIKNDKEVKEIETNIKLDTQLLELIENIVDKKLSTMRSELNELKREVKDLSKLQK